jgi:alanine racemase
MRQTWVEIDLDALHYNIRQIREKTGGSAKLIGVVKADAYGHGAVRCAEVLKDEGVESFAVATIDEALELREAGIDGMIIILGLVPEICADTVVRYELTPVVSSYSSAVKFSEAAAREDTTVYCMIAVDTGMGRIGYRIGTSEEKQYASDEIRKIDELDSLRILGMISHFSTSDEADRSYTDKQLGLFNEFYEKLSADGTSLPYLTIANSAAVMDYPQAHYDAVRPGIILYGCYPSEEVDKSQLDLEPVMSVKANIVYMKTVPAGTSISYGRKFTTERESRIATIAIGYADGYSRALSGNVDVLVRGRRAPVVGNICMDQCMIDVTDIPDISPTDEVVIMGRSGDEQITAEELASKLGTINYEVLCDFGMRLRKVYLEDGRVERD